LNELQPNILQNYKAEVGGGVQAWSLHSYGIELCVLGVVWNAICAPKQSFGGDHQQRWTCDRVRLSCYISHLCNQQRTGIFMHFSYNQFL